MSCLINEQEYYSKVYGGWLGKNIGGTLGVPLEGRKELMDYTFYPILPDEPLENDDLDMQLVWLHALEQYGARITAKELGQEWLEHIFFPFDEYGFALTNLRRGLQAPVSGWFNNPFNNCMGSPIRSEIWAMVAPGAPAVAAYYAYQDAIVDHAGGEGVYGEIFFAAIESAAFIESDRDSLIAIGLSYIPANCRTALAVSSLINWHAEGYNWIQARELILKHYGNENFTDAPQNIAFTILGWLYGEDFGDAILKAANCGYDTDCTAATLGAILGIINGAEQLPERWITPVGDRVVVSPPIKGFNAPKDLDELTRRTLQIGKEVLAVWQVPVQIVQDQPSLGYIPAFEVNTAEYRIPANHNRYLLPRGSVRSLGLELLVDYGEQGPVIGLNQTKMLHLTLINHSFEAWEGDLKLTVPHGWTEIEPLAFQLDCEGSLQWDIKLSSNEVLQTNYKLTLEVHRYHDNHLWNVESLDLYYVGSAHWSITGPNNEQITNAIYAGNQLMLTETLGTEAVGVYKASSCLINPRDCEVKLIIGTGQPVKVSLNGKIILVDVDTTEFVPAYHRAPKNRYVELQLKKGEHLLEIEVLKDDKPLRLFILPVATDNTKTPGPNYAYMEILFAPVKKALK